MVVDYLGVPIAQVFLYFKVGQKIGNNYIWEDTTYTAFNQEQKEAIQYKFELYHEDFADLDNKVNEATPIYNCHAYAFGLTLAWINFIHTFESRGCIFEVDKIQDASIVKFGGNIYQYHSAKPVSVTTSCGLSTYKYVSKFGFGGTYQTSQQAIEAAFNDGYPLVYRYYSFEPPEVQ